MAQLSLILDYSQKPSNIFLDSQGNVKLGDFGLATTHKGESRDGPEADSEVETIYSAIEDISGLLGGSRHSASRASLESAGGESMTGGVGTTFYRAPEQECTQKKDEGSYGVKADIFSLGILIFEMFHPPFATVSFVYLEKSSFLPNVIFLRIWFCFSSKPKVHGAS